MGSHTFGLASPFLVDLGHTHAEHPGKTHGIAEAIPTQTSRQTLAFVVSVRGEPQYNVLPITDVLPTQTTTGAPYLVELHGSSVAHPITDPLGCILAGGGHHGLVMPQPFLVSYYSGSDQAKPVTDPVATVSTHDRHGLVQPDGELAVEDCYFRMLKSHEIGRAMAFPDAYVVLGNERERVRQFGNAVTPPVMSLILERCIETFRR